MIDVNVHCVNHVKCSKCLLLKHMAGDSSLLWPWSGAICRCLAWMGSPREMWEMSHTSAGWVIAVWLTSPDSGPSLLPNVTWAHVSQHSWRRHCTGCKLNSWAWTAHTDLSRKQVPPLKSGATCGAVQRQEFLLRLRYVKQFAFTVFD